MDSSRTSALNFDGPAPNFDVMLLIGLVLVGAAASASAIIQPPFNRYCAALQELGSCHHFRGPFVAADVLAAGRRPPAALAALLHPFAAYEPAGGLRPDHQRDLVDSRHFLDMFLHEGDHDGAVSPLDIPLDRSYLHHPNRWEWN